MLHDSPAVFLLVDDSVQDQRHNRFIALTKRLYSGNAHGMVTGIGLVNLGHSSGEAGDFLPLDYRTYAHLRARPRRPRRTDEKRPFSGHV
ncbi:hypothetical protein [Hymenobacter siberiensis]|uniref:hypothetical protein n=1 Tax=Hymenobacter siberiensis TaxID=2848396 RepID=UPI001C1E0B1E|nr:hypothetical protein [Hymenobacter siberiensis]MBU6122055.1 hypothetical protein [Hymenobacter siberiensis]